MDIEDELKTGWVRFWYYVYWPKYLVVRLKRTTQRRKRMRELLDKITNCFISLNRLYLRNRRYKELVKEYKKYHPGANGLLQTTSWYHKIRLRYYSRRADAKEAILRHFNIGKIR